MRKIVCVLWLGRSLQYLFCFILKLSCAINVLLLKTAFCYNIVKLTPGNRKRTFITWPATVKCDPKLSNLQHSVGYSKTAIFKLKEFMNFIMEKRNILLDNLCSFVSQNFRFKETRSVNFLTDRTVEFTVLLN